MRSLRVLFLIAALALTATPLIAGDAVAHPRLGFRLVVPDGFVTGPDGMRADQLFAFQRGPVGDQGMATFILVTHLGGVLGRERLDPKRGSALGLRVTAFVEQWNGFQIDVFRVAEHVGDLPILTFNAQVPLVPEAIQVSVFGEASREGELREVVRYLLASLEGKTNWLSAAQRIEKGVTVLGSVLGAVIGFLVWRTVRKRKASKARVESDTPADEPRIRGRRAR